MMLEAIHMRHLLILELETGFGSVIILKQKNLRYGSLWMDVNSFASILSLDPALFVYKKLPYAEMVHNWEG
mgnify:CR=1 FL=1